MKNFVHSLPGFAQLALTLALANCSHFSSFPPLEKHKLSFSYSKKYFDSAELVVLPKELKDSFKHIGPKRWMIHLTHPSRTSMVLKEPRYYFPSSSLVYITPLHDSTVSSFAKAYWQLSENARNFKLLLEDRSKSFAPWLVQWNRQVAPWPWLPDEPWKDAGQGLMAKFRLLENSRLYGFRLLCYYAQGNTGIGATNAELTYNFQGMTKDGKFDVSARLAVRHPSLPDSIDDPRAASGNTEKEVVEEQRRVNSWGDDSFFPPLKALDDMVASIIVTP